MRNPVSELQRLEHQGGHDADGDDATPEQDRVPAAHQDVHRGELRGRPRQQSHEEEADQDQLHREEDLIRADQCVLGARTGRFGAERLDERRKCAAEEPARSRVPGATLERRCKSGRRRRQSGDEKQGPEDRTVPQRSGDHRRQEDACVDAEADADHDVRPTEDPDHTGARGQRLGQSPHHGDAFAEPGPRLRQSDQRRDDQNGVHQEQDPRAPGHGRRGLERHVHAVDVELVLEVQKQREHPDA